MSNKSYDSSNSSTGNVFIYVIKKILLQLNLRENLSV